MRGTNPIKVANVAPIPIVINKAGNAQQIKVVNEVNKPNNGTNICFHE